MHEAVLVNKSTESEIQMVNSVEIGLHVLQIRQVHSKRILFVFRFCVVR